MFYFIHMEQRQKWESKHNKFKSNLAWLYKELKPQQMIHEDQ